MGSGRRPDVGSRHGRGAALVANAALVAAVVVFGHACGDDATAADGGGADAAAADAASPDAAIDAGPVRGYALASTGAQLRLESGLALYAADLETDVDVVALHQDFYGVPWEQLAAGDEPPAAWVAAMDDLADLAAELDRPVFLSLALVGGPGRRFLADRVVIGEGGELEKEEAWSPECYDFATAPDGDELRDAYVAYVEWMIDRFEPRWLNVAIEINLFDAGCGDAWPGLVAVERAAYAAARSARPDMIVFPSVQLDHLHGYADGSCPAPMTRAECFEVNYERLADLDRDRFAVSTYPYLIEDFADVDALPNNWLTRAAARGGEQLLIAETGWLATDAVGLLDQQCLTAVVSSPEDQLAYFERVIAAAESGGADLVTWWSNRDVVPAGLMGSCPCTFDDDWCALVALFRSTGGDDPLQQFYGEMVLKIFGAMGLREHDGTPRAAFHERWSEIRAVPLAL